MVELGRLSVLPATIDLAGSEVHLLTRTGREHALARALEPLRDRYDFVLVDCPPSLGILTINGLTAADEVLIPLQCETLEPPRRRPAPRDRRRRARLHPSGPPACGASSPRWSTSGRAHTREVLADVESRYGLEVLEPLVPKSIRFAEAPADGALDPRARPDLTGRGRVRAVPHSCAVERRDRSWSA